MRDKRLKATVPFEKTGTFSKPVGMAAKDGDGKSKGKEARKLKAAAIAAGQVSLQPTIPAEAEEQGNSAPSPTLRTEAQALDGQHAVVRQYMAKQGHVEPTPVQRRVWAAASSGRDVVAQVRRAPSPLRHPSVLGVQGAAVVVSSRQRRCAVQAPTGSGKTLAFLLPAAARLVDAGHGHHSRPEGPLALVFAPTRELAVQTHRAAKPLQALCGLRACCIYGGADREAQKGLLARSPHIVVATPGRCATPLPALCACIQCSMPRSHAPEPRADAASCTGCWICGTKAACGCGASWSLR